MPFPAAPIRRTRFEQVFGPAWIGKDRRQLAVSQGDAMVIEGAFEPVVDIGCHLRPSFRQRKGFARANATAADDNGPDTLAM